MVERISKKLLVILIEYNVIEKDEENLYLYCFISTIEMITNIMITLIIGIVWRKLIETIVFLAAVIPLRSTAGGYHAEKSSSCFIASLSLYFVALILSTNMELSRISSMVIFLLLSLLVGIYTPVDSVHKRLDENQKRMQKKRYIGLIVMLVFIFVIFLYLEVMNLSNILISVMLLVHLTQLLGLLKNTIEGRKTTIQGKF